MYFTVRSLKRVGGQRRYIKHTNHKSEPLAHVRHEPKERVWLPARVRRSDLDGRAVAHLARIDDAVMRCAVRRVACHEGPRVRRPAVHLKGARRLRSCQRTPLDLHDDGDRLQPAHQAERRIVGRIDDVARV